MLVASAEAGIEPVVWTSVAAARDSLQDLLAHNGVRALAKLEAQLRNRQLVQDRASEPVDPVYGPAQAWRPRRAPVPDLQPRAPQPLQRQEQRLRKYCAERGFIVVDVIYEVSSASHGWNCDRQVLEKAALMAEEHNATLAALSVDRFIRGPWRKDKATLLPSGLDFHRLQMLTNNVPLATLIHPDTDSKTVRSIYAKMGFAAQSKPGDKKRQREALKPVALELHEDGLSLRQIVRWIAVPQTTVYAWLQGCSVFV
jgi:hypothetical protein